MTAPLPQEIETLERFMLETIPLASAMQLRMLGYRGESLCLRAPLEPNRNDKGCAFGGSLCGLLTLAGWSLLVLKLKARDEDADVFIADAKTRYLEPLFDDIEVSATVDPDTDWSAFFRTLEQRGRARVRIDSRVRGSNGPACIQSAQFVAKRRGTEADRAQ